MASQSDRKSLDETWSFLDAIGMQMPRDGQGRPFVSARMPSYDDREPLGVSFFRCLHADADLSNLSLPRTFFGRSSLERVNFQNTDLSESRMCWNDFRDCDFSRADLTGCDMRASVFTNCRFTLALLCRAEMRGADFSHCVFSDADMAGAKLTYLERLALRLSPEQKAAVECCWRSARQPGGG